MASRGAKTGSTRVNFADKKILDEITNRIAKGFTEASVAKSYGYSASHFCELKKKHPKLAQAIKDGRHSTEQLVYDKLFMMMSDDKHPKQFNALVFYAKCQLGWNDRADTVVLEAPIKTTSLNFTKEPINNAN